MRNNYLSLHVYFCKFIQVFLTYQTLVMAIGETFDLNQSDLLFLLQISDAVYTLPSEKQIFEYACRTYAAKAEVTEVVIYDLSKPGPELKSRFYHSDNGHTTIPQDIHCVAHFEMYRQQDGLCINDVTAHPDAPLFDGCHIRAVAGVLISNYLLELRSPIRKNWPPSLINLLKSGFERVVKAAGRISELEQFRSRNFNFETTARAIMSLSAGQSGITGFRSQSEIENLKQALLRAALPGDVMPNITDEEIPRTEIEIARSFTREKDQQPGYQEAGRDNMHWVKLGSGQFGDASGNPPYRATEMGTYEFTFSHEALIRDKQNQAFLLHLTVELSTVADPVEVQKKATEMLATYFNFSMAYYSMYNDGLWTTEWQYRAPGVESIVGNHHDDSHPLISSYLKEEKVFVSHNLAADNRLEPGERGVMQDLDVNAVVMAPIFTEGRLKGAFIAAQKQARHWSDDEISLIKEVARRTQGAVDHVLARKALRESEEKYRSLFNSAGVGFCIIELIFEEGTAVDFRWLEVNPAYERQTGLNIQKGDLASEMSPGTENYWLEIYSRVAQTGEAVEFEQWHEPTRRWYDVSASKVGGEGSNQVAVIFDDITERKKAAEMQSFLLQLSDTLRNETSADAIAAQSLQMLYKYLQADHCCASMCLMEDDMLKVTHQVGNMNNIPPGISLSDFPDAVKTLLHGTCVIDDVLNASFLSDAEKQSFNAMGIGGMVISSIRKGPEYPIWGIAAISVKPRTWTRAEIKLIEDVTERTWNAMERANTEAALHRNAERMRFLKEAYQSVVNFAPCQESLHILSRLVISETGGAARTAFYIANADHTELNTIKGGGNMDDAYADEIDGFSIGDDSLACGLAVPTGKPVITPDVYEEPRWKAWTFLAKKYNYRGCWSFPVKTKDNNAVGTFAMYFSDPREATANDMELAELVTSAAAVIISTHLEVQERIRAEKALAESRDKLRQNLVQQNEFLRIATHEVRTPLTVIKLTAQFLKNNLAATDGNESRLLLLDKLNTSVAKLIVLFEDLMQTTKVADGSLELRHAAFDIHALIADVIADQQSVAPERKIINRAEGVLQIEADKNRIEQVIINLLTNANKYSPGDAAIIIETRRMNEMIEVCVKDNGPGIPADEHEKIFKRFYRVKNPSGREGLGVGLYISDVIIKMHGGRIWVDSTTGSGSSFYFTLPLKQTKNI